jgi:HK97 gp10 family phage protein
MIERINNTDQFISESRKKALQFVTTGGLRIRSEMIARVPVDSGALRRSIDTEVENNPVAFSDTGSTSEYAEYVEYGTGIYAESGQGRQTPWTYFDEAKGQFFTTRGQKAQPFAEPAYRSSLPKIKQDAERILKL